MKIKSYLLIISFFLFSIGAIAQRTDTLIKKLDSLSKQTDSAGNQINNINKAAYNETTKITFQGYFILLSSDLKQEFTAPFHWHKKSWIKAGAIVVATSGLALLDEPIQQYALKLRNNNKIVSGIGKHVTKFGGIYEVYTLVGLHIYGLITRNEKIKTTTLLASQAYLTGGTMEYVLKFITNRQRPTIVDPNTGEAEPRFHWLFSKALKGSNSDGFHSAFPSGHTTEAFAAATVYAMEYKDKPLVPIIAYTAASLIGLSRITENRHWATDVLSGAVLGYFTGRQVVNNYHRYAKLKSSQQKKGTVFFNMQFNNFHQLMPGLVYTFR